MPKTTFTSSLAVPLMKKIARCTLKNYKLIVSKHLESFIDQQSNQTVNE